MRIESSLCLFALSLAALGCVAHRPYTLPPAMCAACSRCASEGEEISRAGQRDADCPPGKSGWSYRPSLRSFSGDEPKPWRYDLAIVEFDDHGEFWEPRQLAALRERLEARERDSFVVLFIHGWKNNASPYSEEHKNLYSFKRVLERLAQGIEGAPEIIGIFFAWRGNSLHTIPSLWLGQQATVFNRRVIAEKVAGVSSSHALQRIGHWVKDKKHNCAGCRNRTVAVGHSLGAVVLENVLLRPLTVQTTNPREIFPADLAVLVNSANDAILSRQFLEAFSRGPVTVGGPGCFENPDECYKVPLIVSLTSRGDTATRYAFPAAMTLKSFFRRFRRYPAPTPKGQRYYFTHTPGHTQDPAIVSHKVRAEAGRKGLPRYGAGQGPLDAPTATCLFPRPEVQPWRCDEQNRFRCFESISFASCAPDVKYVIQRDGERESVNNAPYWVMQVPRGVIPSHGDIFNSELIAFLAAIVNLPGVSPEWGAVPVQRMMVGDE